MQRARFLVLGGVLFSALGVAFGCQSVAGIEERKFDSSDKYSALCHEYCDTVMTNCTGDVAVYKTKEICLDVCAHLPEGDAEAGGNSVRCRLAAAENGTAESGFDCRFAGPGGNDQCGSDCEAYCGLLKDACPDDFTALGGECLEKCAALKDTNDFDVKTFYTGNTLQCRLIHVGAALSAPEVHCEHAKFAATVNCVPGATEVPTCPEVCKLTQSVCTGDLAVWESEQQCESACKVFPIGESDDITGNTVACRRYHATVAAGAGSTHCPHTGPTGDGHCGKPADGKGGPCESYCKLLEAGCKGDPGYTFADSAACEAACAADFPDGAKADAGYSVAKAQSGNTLQCRVLHAVRALDDATACGAALGAAPCK